MTKKNDKNERLFAMIPEGEGNALHMSELSARLGMEDREVRKRILDLRKAGYLIVASVNGYFRPTTRGEIRKFYHQRKKSAISTLQSVKAAREALKALEGQLDLSDPAEGLNNGKKNNTES